MMARIIERLGIASLFFVSSVSLAESPSPTVTASFLTISDSPTYYGLVPPDSTGSHTFVITNQGANYATGMTAFLATGTRVSFAGANNVYPGDGGTCGENLSPGDSCTVVVSYVGGSISGETFSDQLSVSCYSGGDTSTKYTSSVGINITVEGNYSDPPPGATDAPVGLNPNMIGD